MKYAIKEVQVILAYAILLGFIFSFNMWGVDGVVDISYGLYNFALFSALSFIGLVFLSATVKIAADRIHHTVTICMSKVGFIASIGLIFILQGVIPLFIPPFFIFDKKGLSFLGGVHQETSLRHYSFIAITGLIMLSILSWILLSFSFTNPLFTVLPYIILFLIVYSLIPFEFLIVLVEDLKGAVSLGTATFYRTRVGFVFLFLFIALGFFSIHYFDLLWTIVFSTTVAIIISFIYFYKIEL